MESTLTRLLLTEQEMQVAAAKAQESLQKARNDLLAAAIELRKPVCSYDLGEHELTREWSDDGCNYIESCSKCDLAVDVTDEVKEEVEQHHADMEWNRYKEDNQ